MISSEKLNSLTAEKSLWDVYRVSRRLPVKRGYIVAEVLAAAAIAIGASCSSSSGADLGDMARAWSATGFSLAIAILGFLLAGYTIFATFTAEEFVGDLVKIDHDKTGLPYLKYTTLQFMQVFVHYLAFLVLHLVVILLGWRGGPFTVALRALVSVFGSAVWRPASIVAMTVIGWFLVHLWFILQSFVFNIYSSVMTMARIRLTPKPPAALPALLALRDEIDRLLKAE